MQGWNWKGIDVVNAHERDPAVARRGVEEAVGAVASGRLDPAPLYTHRYPARPVGRGDRGDARQAGRLRQGAGDVPVSKLKVAFLGVGWIGRHRMQAMLATGAVEAIAVADPLARDGRRGAGARAGGEGGRRPRCDPRTRARRWW